MDLLTRTEELFLLAIWRLNDNAYGVSIADKLTELTDTKWRLEGIYVPLDRLVKKGYLSSYLGNATSVRGGRSKRLYIVTEVGLKALVDTKNMDKNVWDNISLNKLEEGYGK